MKHPRPLAVLAIALLAGSAPRAQEAGQEPNYGRDQATWPPFDRPAYRSALVELGLGAGALGDWDRIEDETELARASDLLIRRLVPALGDATVLADSGEPRALLDLVALIQNDDRPIVRAHATYHAAWAVQRAGDPERAITLWANFLREEPGRTPLDALATFHYANALADHGDRAPAIRAFQIFLERFPNADESLRNAAATRRAELESRGDTPLHLVADEMSNVEASLRSGRVDESVQTRQEAITAELERILEQVEEQERQQNEGAESNQSSTSPAQQSRLPEGQSEVGTLGAPSAVVDRWGDVRDREREEILNEVQTRFRGRYRALLEGYYKRLSERSDR